MSLSKKKNYFLQGTLPVNVVASFFVAADARAHTHTHTLVLFLV